MADDKIPLYEIHQTSFLDMNSTLVEYEKRGTRVVFLVPATPETFRLLALYNENPTVNLLDFVRSLRKVRAHMLALRDGKNGNEVRNEHNYNH